MYLSHEQMQFFEEQGYLFLPSWITLDTISAIHTELDSLLTEESPALVKEQSGASVRAIHGSHLTNQFFARLVQFPPLIQLATQLLQSPVYLYQFKINTKAAFVGDYWEWHQDFIFWHYEDQLPSARILNLAIFLDEVTEFNGPMYLLPGSHQEGMIDVEPSHQKPPSYEGFPDWIANFTARLKYALPQTTVKSLVEKWGMLAPKGSAGSVLVFSSNIVHSSSMNLSPFDRRICILTYSSVDNQPLLGANSRPEFLVSRDFTPITPLATHESLINLNK